MTDTNEIVRSTIIWSLEETIKKQDAEIERLRIVIQDVLDDDEGDYDFLKFKLRNALEGK